MTTKTKVVIWTTTILALALAGLIFFKWFFVYSEGVNDGDINYTESEFTGTYAYLYDHNDYSKMSLQ